MLWVYFLAFTLIAHLFCAVFLFAKSKELSWALKGAFLGLIAVSLYFNEKAEE